MSTHLTRLRRQCEPVQEDTPVPTRDNRITVDRRDLQQLLADHDDLSVRLNALVDALERRLGAP